VGYGVGCSRRVQYTETSGRWREGKRSKYIVIKIKMNLGTPGRHIGGLYE